MVYQIYEICHNPFKIFKELSMYDCTFNEELTVKNIPLKCHLYCDKYSKTLPRLFLVVRDTK